MALNVALLLEELRFLTINPEQHEQGLWAEARTEVPLSPEDSPYEVEAPRPSACGSFGCLAGNTLIHKDVELDWYEATYFRENGKKIQVWQADNVLNETVTVKDDWDGTEYEEPKPISTKARELLDLTEQQADRLFDGDNTQERLWELAEQITAGEITGDPNYWYSDYAVALRDREAKLKAELAAAKVQD